MLKAFTLLLAHISAICGSYSPTDEADKRRQNQYSFCLRDPIWHYAGFKSKKANSFQGIATCYNVRNFYPARPIIAILFSYLQTSFPNRPIQLFKPCFIPHFNKKDISI
jgi:hypothetical protein